MLEETKTLRRFAFYVPLVFCIIYGLIAVCVLQGCQNPDKRVQAAIGLTATKDVFVSTARAAKRLCEQGVIGESDCVEIKAIYGEVRELLISAKEIWKDMSATDSPDSSIGIVYEKHIEAIFVRVARLNEIIRKAVE